MAHSAENKNTQNDQQESLQQQSAKTGFEQKKALFLNPMVVSTALEKDLTTDEQREVIKDDVAEETEKMNTTEEAVKSKDITEEDKSSVHEQFSFGMAKYASLSKGYLDALNDQEDIQDRINKRKEMIATLKKERSLISSLKIKAEQSKNFIDARQQDVKGMKKSLNGSLRLLGGRAKGLMKKVNKIEGNISTYQEHFGTTSLSDLMNKIGNPDIGVSKASKKAEVSVGEKANQLGATAQLMTDKTKDVLGTEISSINPKKVLGETLEAIKETGAPSKADEMIRSGMNSIRESFNRVFKDDLNEHFKKSAIEGIQQLHAIHAGLFNMTLHSQLRRAESGKASKEEAAFYNDNEFTVDSINKVIRIEGPNAKEVPFSIDEKTGFMKFSESYSLFAEGTKEVTPEKQPPTPEASAAEAQSATSGEEVQEKKETQKKSEVLSENERTLYKKQIELALKNKVNLPFSLEDITDDIPFTKLTLKSTSDEKNVLSFDIKENENNELLVRVNDSDEFVPLFNKNLTNTMAIDEDILKQLANKVKEHDNKVVDMPQQQDQQSQAA